jgi:fructose-bisphosphate aldolase class II
MGHNIKPGVATGDQVQEILIMRKKRLSLPAVNVTGSSTINGVLETAAKLNAPVIIQFSNGEHNLMLKRTLMQMKKLCGGIAGAKHIHALAKLWSYSNFTYGPLCKKNLPWIDGLLDASEEHFAWKTIIQLTYD